MWGKHQTLIRTQGRDYVSLGFLGACLRVVGTAEVGMCKGPGWMTGQSVRTKAGGWQGDDHQHQELMEGIGGAGQQRNCPPLSRAPRSQLLPQFLFQRPPSTLPPCLLLRNQAIRCLAVDPQRTALARADLISCLQRLSTTARDSARGWQRKTSPAVLQQVGLPQRKAQSCRARHSLPAQIPAH